MVETITRDELKAKLDRGEDVVLVETLPEEYYRQGHLPGALNMPYEQVQELTPRLLPDKDAEIVTYCMNFT
jgi:rhodanese-related sulfurtransferase